MSRDEGLFGPDSVTWRIHADPSMLVGGMRALLIQALNPLAMAAVAHHSNYQADPWPRLMRTTEYVMATTFGETAEAEAAAARVRAIHRRVNGVDDVTGRPYRANDPELLLWVHAVEVHSFMTAYRRYGGRLSPEDADRYVEEMVRAAELVGVSSRTVPRTMAGLRSYLRAQRLVATPAARAVMKFVLVPPVPLPGGRVPAMPGGRLLVVPGRAVWSVIAAATIAILPRRVRKLYGLPWVPRTPPLQATVFALGRAIRLVSTPPPVRDALARKRSAAA